MKTSEVIQAWKSVLSGRRPSLAIEITRECPLRCPGCYAYEEGHVGGLSLRQLQDKRGDDMVQGVLALVDEYRPLLRNVFAKLDMPEGLIQEFLHPPASPEVCIFAQTTHTVSADLKSKITPCQFGGNPDCSQCGCIASMALAGVGSYKLALGITAGDIYRASTSISKALQNKPLAGKNRAA